MRGIIRSSLLVGLVLAAVMLTPAASVSARSTPRASCPYATCWVGTSGWQVTAYAPQWQNGAGYPWGTYQGFGRSADNIVGHDAWVVVQACDQELVGPNTIPGFGGGWYTFGCNQSETFDWELQVRAAPFPLVSCRFYRTWTYSKVLVTGGWQQADTVSAGIRAC